MLERTQTVSRVHPIVFRGTDLVRAWIFRVTVAQGDQTAFEDATIDLDPAERKPLKAWTQGEVMALVNVAIAGWPDGKPLHPRVIGVHQVLDQRLLIEEQMDFDVGSLPE